MPQNNSQLLRSALKIIHDHNTGVEHLLLDLISEFEKREEEDSKIVSNLMSKHREQSRKISALLVAIEVRIDSIENSSDPDNMNSDKDKEYLVLQEVQAALREICNETEVDDGPK